MRAGTGRTSWWFGGLAAAGVVASHWVTYRLLHLDGHLHETGHGHLGLTSALALGLFVVGSVRFCSLGLAGRSTPSFASLVVRLTALQGAAWVGMEVAERAAVGALPTLGDNAVVLVGLVVQVVVACVAAAVVRLTGRVLEAVAARRGARSRRRVVVHPRLRDRVPHVVPGWGAQGVRGPPPGLAAPAC